MLSKSNKEQLRSVIFRHLDGIATATTAYALHEKGVLNYLLEEQKVDLHQLVNKFDANEGYLNVALRVLCSQGWLEQELDNKSDQIYYSINNNSERAFKLVHLYEDAVNLMKYSDRFASDKMISSDAFIALERIFKKFETNFDLDQSDQDSIEYQILKHIEGAIAGPIIVLLGVNGLFHKYFMEASFTAEEYHKDPESFKKILNLEPAEIDNVKRSIAKIVFGKESVQGLENLTRKDIQSIRQEFLKSETGDGTKIRKIVLNKINELGKNGLSTPSGVELVHSGISLSRMSNSLKGGGKGYDIFLELKANNMLIASCYHDNGYNFTDKLEVDHPEFYKKLTHRSETELLEIESDYTIINDGDLDYLISKVREILVKEDIIQK